MGSFRPHKVWNSADVPCRQLRLSFGFSKLSLCLWKGNHQSFQLTAKTHLMDTYQSSHKEGNNGAAQSLCHSKINKYVFRIQTVQCIVHHNQLFIREVEDNSGSFFHKCVHHGALAPAKRFRETTTSTGASRSSLLTGRISH